MRPSYEAMDRLSRLRESYPRSRSVGREAVERAIALAEDVIAEVEAREAGRADGRIAEAERWHESTKKLADALKARNAQLEKALEEKRRLNESRDQDGEEVKVTIGRSLGGWVVGDLEEIAYRLRCGGAVDETPVKITEYTATANVVAPNLVPLTRPSGAPPSAVPVRPDLSIIERSARPLPTVALVGIAVFLGALLMVLGRVVL